MGAARETQILVAPETEDQRIIASDGARLHAFGHAAALSGDIAMVGATDVRPSDFSAVYVFKRTNGVWSEDQILHAADGHVGDKANFGAAIAIDGTTAVVGAVGAKVGNNIQQGAAFVFKQQSNGQWIQTAKLVASEGAAYNWFGQSVAILGSTIVVSGYGESVNGKIQQGAAYVYTEVDGEWTQTQRVTSNDGVADDRFSFTVALTDSSLLIGAKIASRGYPGAMYVFRKVDGVWTQSQKFNGAAGANFGQSLAAQGSTAVAGATNPYNQGAAYVFSEVNGSWVQSAELLSGEAATSINFGYAVDISGSAILVGANRVPVNGNIGAGAGYLFVHSNGAWALKQKFVASQPIAEDTLGEAVALDGATALVSSARVNVNGDFLRGAAHLYTSETGAAAPIAVVTPDPLALVAQSGASGSAFLTIANTGGSDLTFDIGESASRDIAQSSFASRASEATQSWDAQLAQIGGAPVLLADTMISQMLDNSPGAAGVSCGAAGVRTSANSWWRRFYFNEHAAIGASAQISSVTVSSGTIEASSGGPASMPVKIRLYTIAHGVTVDTIPTNALSLIGSGAATIVNGLISTTIPVTGTVTDTVGKDLVVEFHTDGNQEGGQFFPGANPTAETHPTFFSAPECNIPEPVTAGSIGFPNFHLTMIVNVGTGPLTGCQNPSDVPWLSEIPTSGVVAPGASTDVKVSANASNLAPGNYSANLCVSTNDPFQRLITLPVSLSVNAIADRIHCDGFDGSVCPGSAAHNE